MYWRITMTPEQRKQIIADAVNQIKSQMPDEVIDKYG